MIKYFMIIYQTVVEDEVSPGLYLFGPGISVRLESEKGWEGVLPGPFHHKADRRWGREVGLLHSVGTKQQQLPASQ